MKYSQYIEFEKLLNEHDLTFSDVKENPEVLNEIGIVGGILAGVLGGVGLLFRKYILSWGIKIAYVKKLDFVAKRFEKRMLKHVSALGKKSILFRQGLVAKEKKMEHIQGAEAEEEKKVIQQQKQTWDSTLSKDINNFIGKTLGNQTKLIYNKIDNLKRSKEGHKIALKNYWERLIADIKLSAYQKLSEDGIVTDPDVLKTYERIASDEKNEAKENLRNIRKILRQEKKEKEKKEKEQTKKKGERESEEKNLLAYKIDNLKNSKGMMSEISFLRKLRLIIVDGKNIEDKEEQNEIARLLIDKFGKDTIKDAYIKGKEHGEDDEQDEEDEQEDSRGLEQEDNF